MKSRTVRKHGQSADPAGLDSLDQPASPAALASGQGKGVIQPCPPKRFARCASNRSFRRRDDCALPKRVRLYRPKPLAVPVSADPRTALPAPLRSRKAGAGVPADATSQQAKQERSRCFAMPRSASAANTRGPGKRWRSWLIKCHFWPHPPATTNSTARAWAARRSAAPLAPESGQRCQGWTGPGIVQGRRRRPESGQRWFRSLRRTFSR